MSLVRAKVTLPNGCCGAPVQTDCEYANPCLDCRFFITTGDFLRQHRQQRNLAEEIDQVVTRTLAGTWDNADARNRGVRRATAAVFRRYTLKPVGEPYDSTVACIEAHYLVD
ncbi:hypothetical protein [Streptomyces sp. NPDC018972]|uniref:hypothetical protein n=1 Tax=Streptomyces sp. NPDC018972 TaxID=3365060 RepID=UPI0037B94848